MTITNVESLSQPSKVLTTTPAITQHTNKTSTKDQTNVKISSSANSGNVVNHSAATTKLSTKTPPLPADMISPPKKATDHSINSIISSAVPVTSHSKNENANTPADPLGSSGTTRVINLDNLSTNDILSTAAASTDTNIRIKTVESLNKSVPKSAAASAANPPKASKDKDGTSKKSGSNTQSGTSVLKASSVLLPKPLPADPTATKTTASSKASQGSSSKTNFAASKPNTAVPNTQSNVPKASPADNKSAPASATHSVEEISSDSDDVEFVSETHIKKSKHHMQNVIKQMKTSNNSSRSSSPSSQAQSNLLRRRRDSSIDGKEELDVKQIMEAIKELQVLNEMIFFSFDFVLFYRCKK